MIGIRCSDSQHFCLSWEACFQAGMKHINLSFAACGFLGIYHLGAASAFCKHGQKLLRNVKAFAGASAGSLAASVLLTAPEKIQVIKCVKQTVFLRQKLSLNSKDER